ncbi:MAG: hypothetical protein ACRC5M_02870 [Anaeroplasmataceae bacterium]
MSLVLFKGLRNNSSTNYKYSRKKTKIEVVRRILSGNLYVKDIEFIRFRATCRKSKKYSDMSYTILCELWEEMESNGLRCFMSIIESDTIDYSKEVYCLGHELIIVNGKIKIVRWII